MPIIEFFRRQSGNRKAFLFLVIIIGIFFLPVILNQQTFFSAVPGLPLSGGPYEHSYLRVPWNLDPSSYMIFEASQTMYWVRELQKGTFALWDPYQGNGFPISASITSGMYVPLKFVLFFLFPYLKTFDYYILLRFLIAGFGTYLFLKKLRLSHRSALLGGVAYMFSGYFILWITQSSLPADMMVPWILLGIERLFEVPLGRNMLFLAIVWAMMVLSNSPEAVVVITLFSLCYFLFEYLRKKSDRAVFFAFILSAALALIISLPLLWDTILSFVQGINAHGEGFVLSVHLHSLLERFLQVFTVPVSPILFFEIAQLGGLFKGDFIVPYVGMFIILLSLSAFSAKKDKEEKIRTWFWGGTLIFFVLYWAGIPPLVWIEKLPLFSQIIFHKYNSVFYFALAVLAAMGFEKMRRENVDRKKFNIILAALALPIGGLFLFSSTFRGFYKLTFAPERLQKITAQMASLTAAIQTPISWFVNAPYFYAAVIFGLTALIVALFFFLWRKKLYTLIFVFMIAELFLYMPKLREGFGPFNSFKEPPFVAYLKSRPDIEYYRIFGVGRLLEPWAASAYGLKDIRSGAGVMLRQHYEFIRPFLESGYLRDVGYSKAAFNGWYAGRVEQINKENNYFLPTFRNGSVKYIISEEALLADVPYKLIYNKEVKIYENNDVLPLSYIKIDDGNIDKGVIIVEHGANRIVLQANAPKDGLLVLGETHYPGWRVFVDGKENKIVPVKEMFRGVRLEGGPHEVVFLYWPFSRETLRALVNDIFEY